MFRFKKNIKNNKGFTLVEIMVVIAIVITLVAVIAPRYTVYIERSKQANDFQVATEIVDATLLLITDPRNEIPTDALIRVAWLTGNSNKSIEVGAAHDSGIKEVKHSNGLSLAENLENQLNEIISGESNVGAQSAAGKSQHFIFRIDVATREIEVAGGNPNPDDNGWNAGSNLWVTEIGVDFPLSDEFYFHY